MKMKMNHAEAFKLFNEKIIRVEERMAAYFGSDEFLPEWFGEKLKLEKLKGLRVSINLLQDVLVALDNMGCDCCFELISELYSGIEEEQEVLLFKGVAV